MALALGLINTNMMLYKYLFYFCSYLEKKYDKFGGDPYISSYILVGVILSTNVFITLDIACILIQSVDFDNIIVNSMPFFGVMMIALSYLYYRHNNRRETIFDEIHQATIGKKIKYGIICLVYVVISFGLWFVCNDIICVLRNGNGLTYAEIIVAALHLTYWD